MDIVALLEVLVKEIMQLRKNFFEKSKRFL